jgi:hypothetical protein
LQTWTYAQASCVKLPTGKNFKGPSSEENDAMDAREVKRVESEAWGKSSFAEIERLSAKSSHIIGALILKRSIQDFDIADKNIINVGGGHGEEAEFLLKNGAGAVKILDIAEGQLKNACVRGQKHHLDNLQRIKGDAENLLFVDNCFDVGYVFMAFHHCPDYSQGIFEICRVSRQVIFVEIMTPVLTRILTKLGFFQEEGCGIAPNRLNGKRVKKVLINQQLNPKLTYYFVVPLYTHNPFVIRCLVSVFWLSNSLVNRSKGIGLLCGNVAVITGTPKTVDTA